MAKRPRFLLDPFRPFGRFNPFDDGDFTRLMREDGPHFDLFETDKEVVITAELPGVKKEDISIKVSENGLELKVRQREENEKEHKAKSGYEYSYSSRFSGYSRFVSFPSTVLGGKAKASYKNGVLEVRAPKLAAKKRGTEVKIE
ncbi:MAG: Hsp20/alpha crystallin family protein [Candidatus Micrarchaeia archaeon]